MSARVTKSTKRLRDIKSLTDAGLLAPERQSEYEILAQRYDIGITPHVLSTIQDRENALADPVGRQYVPSLEEMKIHPDEMTDPIGDEAHSPVKGLVHRYPDRVLLKVSNVCAVYCRYCFRREMIGAGSDGMGQDDLEQAVAYIAENKGIWEVILTGGDPLVLSPRRLQDIVDRLNIIEHVQIVRIHTRVPVANPSHINDTILSVLKSVRKSLHIVVHINHPQEITPETEGCLGFLRDVRASLLSQSVLLKGVNDDAEILEKLFRRLVTLHVKPYYLHHPDMAKGTSHFRVSLARGQEIMKKLRGRVSGLCLPSYVLDIPGGYGKAVVEAGVCEEAGGGLYTVTDYKGAQHIYRSEEGGA